MSKKNLVVFLLIFVLVCSAGFVAFNGANIGGKEIQPIGKQVKLGLDLKGGVFVVLEAQTDLKGEELQSKMTEAKSVIDQRVNGMGLTEPNIVLEGEKRIRVELPGVADVNEAIDMIGKTAELRFAYLDKSLPNEATAWTEEQLKAYVLENGVTAVSGKNVKKSEAVYQKDQVTGASTPVVSLEFDSEGAKLFEDATALLSSKSDRLERTLFIILDKDVISMPAVKQGMVITNGQAVIEGGFTVETASQLATLIQAGALPIELKEVQSSVIGPTLGLESLDKSLFAGMLGLAVIFIFMLVYYRLPGFIADIGLAIYILLFFTALIGFNATLTLPGIAGIILSIGMAVDANVVIFERIKDELRSGKSIRSSIESGFQRATITVLDANITTLIAGIVLYIFGSGPIKGFAITLMLGLVVSMITAIFISKFLLKLLVNSSKKIANNPKLFGVKEVA